MITIKAVVRSGHKRKDGTFPVVIRVTHGQKSRYLPTTISCVASDLRGRKIKNTDIVARCNELCDRMRKEAASITVFDLEGRDVDYVVRVIKERMRGEDFRLDFFEWADVFLKTKTEGNRPKYESALSAFARFLGRRQCDINDITHSMLVSFAEACDSGRKLVYSRLAGKVVETDKPRTRIISPQYLSRMSHIFEAAKDRYNDEDGGAVVIPRSPFRKLRLTPPAPTTGQRPLDTAVIQAMMDTPADDPERLHVDVFLASFGLMGANLVDMYSAAPPKGGKWVYFRTKTKNRRSDRSRVEVLLQPEITAVLGRLGAGSSTEAWLPRVRALGKNASIAGQTVNRGLRRWSEKRGFGDFTMYAARHSWATIARRCGVEKATIDEGLGHVGDFRIADIYAERDWQLVADANRKVLEKFNW